VYWRDGEGNPILATEEQLPGFPEPEPVSDDNLQADILEALSRRPELRMLDTMRQQIQVDYSEAVNQMQPEVNAVLWGSQDVGSPTSSKRDKSPYESEASVFLEVPAQRRKARGKMTETQGKLAQLAAKRRITEDKISVDVRMAHAALKSAWEQVSLTQEALDRAEDLAVRELQNQEAGASDLLKVSLREQYAVESAEKHVEALKLYFESRADSRAAMALDQIDR
jgi:outer membrane protein TolC